MLKVLDSYSKQTEQKARELDAANAKLTRKRAAIKELKRTGHELESKNLKLQAKLTEMGKFSLNLVKSIRIHQKALKEQVEKDQSVLMGEVQATTR